MRRPFVRWISLALLASVALASCASADEPAPAPAGPPALLPPLTEAGPDRPPLDGGADADAAPPSRCSLDGFCHTEVPEGLDGGAPAALSLRDVFATNDEAWAVAVTGEILHYQGDTWSVEYPSHKTLRSLGGTSATDLWVVGDEGVVLRRTVSGGVASWVAVPSGTTGNLQSAWAAAPGDVWIVGTTGALHSKGTPGTAGFAFVPAKPPAALLDGLTGLYRVWGTDAQNVWVMGPDPCLDPDAVCEYGQTHVLRYRTLADGGARWSRVDIGINPLFDVAVAAAAATPDNQIALAGNEYLNGCVATNPISDDAGDAGVTWQASGVCVRQRALWMRSASQGWSVGTDGLAQEWDGNHWRPARLTITAVPIANHLYSVRGARAPSGTELWIVGDGIALHRHLAP